MTEQRELYPVQLRMRWLDYSPALNWHARRRVDTALRRFGNRVREVNVQISDGNGPRGGADDKRCDIEVMLRPSGSVAVSAAAGDPYLAVDLAVRRLRAVVRAHLARRRERRERFELTKIA